MHLYYRKPAIYIVYYHLVDSKIVIFVQVSIIMRKYDHKSKKIEKNKKSNQSLDNFYSNEQKHEEHAKKERKTHQDHEMEIFEHLKNHTKKILNKNKSENKK